MISRIIDEKQIRSFEELLEGSKRIVTLTHMSPDGDAIGSSLAAQAVFTALGKEVRCIIPDMMLNTLKILPGASDITDATRYPDFARQLIAEADLIICLDFNELKRIGRLAEAVAEAAAPKVLIDHHLNPGNFAKVALSYPALSSTCYLLFRVLCRLELFNFIGRDAAECLLAGMMTDTGNFSYNASDPELYIVVAELLKKGADKEFLYREIFDRASAHKLRLNGYALSRKMEVFTREGGALITLTRDELNRFHYSKGDTEGLVNRPLAIPGVVYSAFMREEDGYVKVSMRSVGDFPVNELCEKYFGGGGHLNAAGGEFAGTMAEAVELFRSLLPRYQSKAKKK